MKLKLVRESFGDTFTEGRLYINDEFECYTIEDTDRKLEEEGEKVYGKTAIPKGNYRVNISMSPRFKKPLIEILNVPQFTGVRIHTGNSSANTEGCIIVGKDNKIADDDWIGQSKLAYEPLHAKVQEALTAGDLVTIEIV